MQSENFGQILHRFVEMKAENLACLCKYLDSCPIWVWFVSFSSLIVI